MAQARLVDVAKRRGDAASGVRSEAHINPGADPERINPSDAATGAALAGARREQTDGRPTVAAAADRDGGARSSATVRHNRRLFGYEVAVRDGALAGVALYQRHERRIAFLETEIETRHEGADLGGRLARAALDDARDLHLEVVPLCPFIAAYIRGHADEYLDLVVPAMREALVEDGRQI